MSDSDDFKGDSKKRKVDKGKKGKGDDKPLKKKKEVEEEEEEKEEAEDEGKKSKKSKSQPDKKKAKSDTNEVFIDLGAKKRVSVSTFKGEKRVDLRNYYGTDGDLKPTPKGISLTKKEWEVLKDSIDKIDKLMA